MEKETAPSTRLYNLAAEYSLQGGAFAASEMHAINTTGEARRRQKQVPYINVNYAFIEDSTQLQNKKETFSKYTKGKKTRGKRGSALSVILMKLCRKLCLDLPKKNLVFNP